MFGIIAYEGSDVRSFDEACNAARSFGAVVTVVVSTPRVRLGIMGSGLSVGSSSDAVWFGSAAQQTSGTAKNPEHLLNGAPDDVVAAGVTQEHLVLAAGRGNHRLFIHETPTGRLASSSLSVLARSQSSGIDRSYEDFLLGFSFLPIPRTPYEGIRVLVPGTRLIAENSESVAPAVIETPTVPSSFASAIPELRNRFFASLEELAAGEKRHAVLLGGFDSMLVAASLRQMGHEVHTYTFSFGNPKYEQRNIAEFVASQGIIHHPVQITPELIADNLRTFGSHFFQPGALAHYQIHTLIGSQQIAADGHNRIFNGDGCDALFLSFPTVDQRAALTKRLEMIPDWGIRAGSLALRNRLAERHLGHVGRTMRSMLGNFLLEEPARGHLPNRYIDEYALSQLRVGAAPAQTETIEEIRNRLAQDVVGQVGTRRAFHGNGLTGQSKVKVDGSVAATGLPHFTPYTHPIFRTFVAGLPIDYLKKQDSSPGGNGKEVLVAMVREYGILPDVIIQQPKQSPSDSPVDNWYRQELRQEIFNQLEDLPFEWDRDYIQIVLQTKWAENWYREKVANNSQTLQAIGLLASYASFGRVIAL